MTEDIDLVRHVATARGVAYFHKPIGEPIGGGGRGTVKVSLKSAAYVVNGKGYNEFGSAVDAADRLFDAPATGAPGLKVPLAPSHTRVLSNGGPMALVRPAVNKRSNGGPMALAPHEVTTKRQPSMGPGPLMPSRNSKDKVSPVEQDIAALIKQYEPDDKALAEAAAWWKTHSVSKPPEQKQLAKDLGLDPSLAHLTVPQLRKHIKSVETSPEDRERMKKDLVKRVALAKQAAREAEGFVGHLNEALESKPPEADLAPIIGETLAAHPNLGVLAHIWDRLRLSGYKFHKTFAPGGAARDELPRIIARNVVTVLILAVALHVGIVIPGLGGG